MSVLLYLSIKRANLTILGKITLNERMTKYIAAIVWLLHSSQIDGILRIE